MDRSLARRNHRLCLLAGEDRVMVESAIGNALALQKLEQSGRVGRVLWFHVGV